MNFKRGQQVVIHNYTYTDWKGKPFNPPDSFATWGVKASETVAKVLGDVAALASAAGKLDAVHIITHGAPNFFQLGSDNVSMSKNVEQFTKLNGAARNIVIWACQVGGTMIPGAAQNPNSLGTAIAQLTGAKVIVGQQNQAGAAFGVPGVGANGNRIINPNFFWGEIYLCHGDGGHMVIFKDSRNGQAQIDIEPYIFSSAAKAA